MPVHSPHQAALVQLKRNESDSARLLKLHIRCQILSFLRFTHTCDTIRLYKHNQAGCAQRLHRGPVSLPSSCSRRALALPWGTTAANYLMQLSVGAGKEAAQPQPGTEGRASPRGAGPQSGAGPGTGPGPPAPPLPAPWRPQPRAAAGPVTATPRARPIQPRRGAGPHLASRRLTGTPPPPARR